jgi:UPF0755 protein
MSTFFRCARLIFGIIVIVGILWLIRFSYRVITAPDPIVPRKESQITLIEGWTVDQMGEYLAAEKGVKASSTIALIGRSANRAPFDLRLRQEYSFLRSLPADRSLEGYLFPDTYRVFDDELPEGLVRKQLDEFQSRFGSTTLTTSAPLKNLDQIIILASIVEKEVQTLKDKKIVAGIFQKRMKDGIALQSDATLNYALGSGARADRGALASITPYNSYKYRGLPPSPICNPGADAIEAVLHPTITNYRYFLTTPEGRVLYAATLEQHAVNRRKAGY